MGKRAATPTGGNASSVKSSLPVSDPTSKPTKKARASAVPKDKTQTDSAKSKSKAKKNGDSNPFESTPPKGQKTLTGVVVTKPQQETPRPGQHDVADSSQIPKTSHSTVASPAPNDATVATATATSSASPLEASAAPDISAGLSDGKIVREDVQIADMLDEMQREGKVENTEIEKDKDDTDARSTLTEKMEELMDEELLVDSGRSDSQTSDGNKDAKDNVAPNGDCTKNTMTMSGNCDKSLNQIDLNDPNYKKVIEEARGHHLFIPYLMDIRNNARNPRNSVEGWMFARQDPYGDLVDFNKYRKKYFVEPLDLSKINFNYQGPDAVGGAAGVKFHEYKYPLPKNKDGTVKTLKTHEHHIKDSSASLTPPPTSVMSATLPKSEVPTSEQVMSTPSGKDVGQVAMVVEPSPSVHPGAGVETKDGNGPDVTTVERDVLGSKQDVNETDVKSGPALISQHDSLQGEAAPPTHVYDQSEEQSGPSPAALPQHTENESTKMSMTACEHPPDPADGSESSPVGTPSPLKTASGFRGGEVESDPNDSDFVDPGCERREKGRIGDDGETLTMKRKKPRLTKPLPKSSNQLNVHGQNHDDKSSSWAQKLVNADGSVDMQNLLANMSSHFIKKCREKTMKDTIGLPPRLTLASLCSGSGAGELVFESAVSQLSEEFLCPLQYDIAFVCEKEAWKQAYLINNIIPKETCVFDDVVTLGAIADKNPSATLCSTTDAESDRKKLKGKATVEEKLKTPHYCVHHKKSCDPRTKEIFMLKSGFSCKGNSRMNTKFSDFRESMKKNDFSSCSVSTFYGTLGVIAAVRPKIVVLENVDTIGSETSPDSNLSRVMSELGALDDGMYACHVYRITTADYFLPQNRIRCYIVAVRMDGSVTSFLQPDAFFGAVGKLLDELKCGPLPLKSFLLPDGDPYLNAELERRQAFRDEQERRIRDGEVHKDTKWVTQHMDACEEIGVTWPPPVPKHLAKNEWLAVVQKREQEIICISHNLNPSNLWVDTSQNVSRARPSTHEEVSTVVPGSHLWNFSINRYLTGREFMRVQRYPYESLPGAAALTDAQCADVAGNSFSTSAICAVDISVLLSIESMSDGDNEITQVAIRDALASMNDAADDVEFDL